MLQILKFPNDLLREQMPPFDFDNPPMDPVQLEKDMLEAMYAGNGIGLAANQVGIKARVFVMGSNQMPDNGMAFFNPVIEATTEAIDEYEEGCLSFPGIYVPIKRPKAIKVRWQTSAGELQTAELSGYECVCFLHEFDHLEGIVFKDRVSTIKWALGIKKSQPKKKRK